jgi:outer membrane protein assembly factor BamB
MREHPLSRPAVLPSLALCFALALALAAAALVGCEKKVEVPDPIPEPTAVPLNSFVRGWASGLDLPAGDSVKQVHAREDKVFVYTGAGQIITIARESGQLLWAANIRATDRAGMHPPVVLKDKVVIPTSSTLEVYQPNDGVFVRSIKLPVATRSDAVGVGDHVFLGGDVAGAGRMVAVDVSREYGNTLWELLIPRGGLASTPAIYETALFIGGGDGNVYAVAQSNREPLWTLKDSVFETQGPITGDLAADAGGVYVASSDSRLYCLARNTGRLKWQFYASDALHDGPVVTKALVYQAVPGQGIAAIPNGEGEFNRKAAWIALGMTQYLAEDDKLVYLRRGGDNAIVAVDKQTGEQKFENKRRDLVTFGVNRKNDGVIFAASKTNRVMAIKPVMRPGVVGEIVWNESDAGDAGALTQAR